MASEAATALVAVQREMQKAAAPGDPEPRRALARVLLHPSLGQVEEACDLLQQAALSLRLAPPTARTLPSPAGAGATLPRLLSDLHLQSLSQHIDILIEPGMMT